MYEDPIQIRPYQPPDRGYYFDLRNCDIKIVRYTLEDNGFRELPSQSKNDGARSMQAAVSATRAGFTGFDLNQKPYASLIWYVSSIKNASY